MRTFWVICTKVSFDLYYVGDSEEPNKFPEGKWSFSIYDAKQYPTFNDAEFERLALGLKEAIVEEHIFQDKLIND